MQGDSNQHLKETAAKLQQTLHNFGVEVTRVFGVVTPTKAILTPSNSLMT